MSDVQDVARFSSEQTAAVPDNPARYRSEPLAALLAVFSVWGSGGFISALSRQAGTDLDTTSVVGVTMLARHGAMRPSTLAGHLRVGASNVSKISAQLIEQGFVEKIADPADARASLLQLTPQGVALMHTLVVAGDAMMDDILVGWSSTDRAAFARQLQRFELSALRYAADIQSA
ncbi:MarR family winged helix-turn-helix transcriptional regulator [Glaciibacter psychrotolerans]|uniref:DNA-binding MarR family transcriptional regulator n=1 Tax=Glaciibacter psychrotolerans TaxID=670054 RepID=A0A7Z0ED44_9MICO|nr:MarR family winged helix-turn-helix transcriptional regulator [Leifsonia psychrotolerans]NYJ18737.1 DNA-binding MarR family transcriptional regulator [Leifsonia psychrotolerans]